MITHEGLDRNFQFLVLEVQKQIEATHRLVDEPSEGLINRILSRDNYIDTLKALIEKKYISYFRHTDMIDKRSANLATALNVTTGNLERIADFCVNLAKRIRGLNNPACLIPLKCGEYFEVLHEAIPLVGEAFASVDTATALRLCKAEAKLDRLYDADFRSISDQLRAGSDETDDLLNSLAIVHYLERMGDALLNIGEAVLFAATGEKVKLHEYTRLRDALMARQPDTTMGDYSFEFGWETRSGCRIAKVVDKSDGNEELEAIFKKGQAEKVRCERMNIARWEQVDPRLPPKVLEFRESEDDAALLLEFIDGLTIRDLVLSRDPHNTDEGLAALEQMLRKVWKKTRKNKPVHARFLKQTRARLDDVFRLHPELRNEHYDVGTLSVSSLEELLDKGETADNELAAPFSTLIHGDLNTDNIIYSRRDRSIRIIDLYRSGESDYVQDVSVFLVSNFRVPVFEPAVREELNRVILRFYHFAAEFAEEVGDKTFAARLVMGLARSYITSTRFEFDQEFAKLMYMRTVYLLEKIVSHMPRPWSELKFADDILLY